MPLSSARRHLHRLAATMLLVWLFGVAAGIANACIVGASATAGGAATGAQLLDPQSADAADDHAEANCLDFCDKASSSPLNQAADDGMFTVAPATAACLGSTPGSAPAPWQPVALAHPGEPPIIIAFRRLAL